MERITVEIRNPKVKRILQDLASLDLISIQTKPADKNTFKDLLDRFRSRETAPEMEEITREVESVRSKRHAAKAR